MYNDIRHVRMVNSCINYKKKYNMVSYLRLNSNLLGLRVKRFLGLLSYFAYILLLFITMNTASENGCEDDNESREKSMAFWPLG